jgi:hypothetical protein
MEPRLEKWPPVENQDPLRMIKSAFDSPFNPLSDMLHLQNEHDPLLKETRK